MLRDGVGLPVSVSVSTSASVSVCVPLVVVRQFVLGRTRVLIHDSPRLGRSGTAAYTSLPRFPPLSLTSLPSHPRWDSVQARVSSESWPGVGWSCAWKYQNRKANHNKPQTT
ncbi:hypothetical protein CGRA01v4_08075 [Colletotrichum graminicola]|nr:hypothetical protein CGRA01v4_08075 [Colletotrichum graminicola]